MTGYDAIVVGARVGGASTAMLLARAGVRVALLDKAPYGTDTMSTHGFMRAGVLQLARWGLLDRIAAAGTPPIRSTTFRYGGDEAVHISIRHSAGVDALYAPRRHVVDAILVDAAVEAGADVFHESRVDELLQHPSGRVTGVRATTPGGSRHLSARFVIGADGIGSPIARQVGARTIRRGRAASAVRYAYFSGLDAAGYEWLYGDRAAAGIIPTNDDLACVFVATSPTSMRSLARTHTDDTLMSTLFQLAAPGHLRRLATATRESRIRGWAGLADHVRHSWGPGWALVGDAGYYKDPITTHGMTQAVRDAELLAGAIVEAVSGSRSEAAALDHYQRSRDQLSAPLFQVSDEIAAYNWDARLVQPLLRRVSAAMTDEVELLESLPVPGDPAAGPRQADIDVARR